MAERLRGLAANWATTPFGQMAGAAAEAVDHHLEQERARAIETLGLASKADLEALGARVEAVERRLG